MAVTLADQDRLAPDQLDLVSTAEPRSTPPAQRRLVVDPFLDAPPHSPPDATASGRGVRSLGRDDRRLRSWVARVATLAACLGLAAGAAVAGSTAPGGATARPGAPSAASARGVATVARATAPEPARTPPCGGALWAWGPSLIPACSPGPVFQIRH
ncbi:MAG TPA: hypothetical protein VFP54_06165 [Acidimicrobiales bacterium]|nr:hypothetical protein [Acidimicrobiales bacterium]